MKGLSKNLLSLAVATTFGFAALSATTNAAESKVDAGLASDAAGKFYGKVEAGFGFGSSPSLKGSDKITLIKTGATNTLGNDDAPFNKALRGFEGALALGYRISEPIRGELMVHYMLNKNTSKTSAGNDNSHFNRTSWGVTANGYYDFDTNTSIIPFVTIGLGAEKTQYKLYDKKGTLVDAEDEAKTTAQTKALESGVKFGKNKTSFIYQGGAGLSYVVTPGVNVDLTYRIIHVPSLSLKGSNIADDTFQATLKDEAKTQEITLKKKFKHSVRAGIRLQF
jgi:opacity protein-like surface antigen